MLQLHVPASAPLECTLTVDDVQVLLKQRGPHWQRKSKNTCTLTWIWFIDCNANTEPFYIALISADFMQHLLFDRYLCFHPIYSLVRVIRHGAAFSLKK